MTEPVSKQLKDLDNGFLRVFKHVVYLHVGAEGHLVILFLGSILTGDMHTSKGCLHSVEITEETILECGWQACHIPGDC